MLRHLLFTTPGILAPHRKHCAILICKDIVVLTFAFHDENQKKRKKIRKAGPQKNKI